MRALLFAALLSLLSSLLPSETWLASSVYAQSSVQIAVPVYPPLCNQDGEGAVCDLFKAAYRAVGVDAQLIAMPIRRGEVQLLHNQIDAMASGDLFIQGPERKNISSVPVVNVLVSLFFYTPNFAIPDSLDSFDELRGYTAAVITNSPNLELYQRYGINTAQAETPEQLLLMARRGRVEFAEASLLTGFFMIQKNAPEVAELFDFLHINNLESTLSFHLGNPKSATLKTQFEKGLQRIWDSGEYRSILESYWGKNNVPQTVFIHQYPIQGVDQANPIKYLSVRRDAAGRIIEPDSQ